MLGARVKSAEEQAVRKQPEREHQQKIEKMTCEKSKVEEDIKTMESSIS